MVTLPHSPNLQRAALTLVPEARSPPQPRTLEICQSGIWALGHLPDLGRSCLQ